MQRIVRKPLGEFFHKSFACLSKGFFVEFFVAMMLLFDTAILSYLLLVLLSRSRRTFVNSKLFIVMHLFRRCLCSIQYGSISKNNSFDKCTKANLCVQLSDRLTVVDGHAFTSSKRYSKVFL